MKEKTKESPKKWAMVKLDDTVAMAEKYRKLAMKDIIEKIVVNDNILNFSTIVVRINPVGMGKKMYCKFSLNGKLYQLEFDYDTEVVNKNDVIFSIVSTLAKEILIQNRNIFASLL